MFINYSQINLVLLTFVFWDLCKPAWNIGMLGPVDLEFKTMEVCEGTQPEVNFMITQRKFNRTISIMDISVMTPYDIDDSTTLELNGWMKKEGGYKPGTFYLKDGACTVLDLCLGDMFTDILKAAGTDGCPLPAGDHVAGNYYFDNTKFNVPHIFGEYKMGITLSKDDVVNSCMWIYYDLVPKRK